MNKWIIVAGLLLLSVSVAAEETPVPLGITTGDIGTTAYRVGMDLKCLAEQNGMDLAVFKSSGSVENIYAVYQSPGNHLGVVQSDVLAFVAKVQSDPRIKLIADKIKWVLPLYRQEVHILANAGIRNFSDLQGKRVAVGQIGGGTYLTSRLLFEIAGIVPDPILTMGEAAALAALKAGRIDAMISVDGAPVERFALDVLPADGLHLVPIAHDGIRSLYPVARIPAGTYAWQPDAVDTVSVRAVLVAYDFRNQYCEAIGKLAWLIRQNLNRLRFNGHPKWQSVDLDATEQGWDPYPCVTGYTPTVVAATDDVLPALAPNPVAAAIVTVFRH